MGWLKQRLERYHSIRYTLLLYNMLLFILIICIIIICNLSSFSSLQAYTNSFNQYSQLSQFYKNVAEANEHAKNYFYMRDPKDYNEYIKSINRANDSLHKLKEGTSNQELAWRYGRLQNMVLTHNEIAEEIIVNRGQRGYSYSERYKFLTRVGEHINTTSIDYYNLITDDMSVHRDYMVKSWTKQLTVVLIIVIIMIIAAVSVSVVAVKSITTPIGLIVKNINKIKQGKYNLKQVKNTGQEISVLCEAFDDMAKSVQNHVLSVQENARLSTQLLEKENENLKMSKLLTEAELKMLQGQINPHFLFNTLSMISKMAYLENAEKTCDLMVTTANLLRYSLDKLNKTSNLFGEIKCTHNYLSIQQSRFGQRVTFNLFAASDLPNVTMPGMILQPIIENAVKHGIGDMLFGAVVSVQIYHDTDNIYISVEDNGKGMSSELLESIVEENPAVSGQEKKMGIGIYNVKRRLEMFYGADSSMRVESCEGFGTVVIVTIPIKEQEDVDNETVIGI